MTHLAKVRYYADIMNVTQTKQGCPFCRGNNVLKGPVVAVGNSAYALIPTDFTDCYLIIPESHAESPLDLPDDWWSDFKALLDKLPVKGDYNISLNYGKNSGQTMKHLHFWIVPRPANTPASGKGLAGLIAEKNEQ